MRLNSLVEDIYDLFNRGEPIKQENIQKFAEGLGQRISERVSEQERSSYLRLSNIGVPCDRKLWYTVNQPEKAEPLPPHTKLKFLYGDIQEELLLMLAREAGHEVRGEQDRLEINGVPGHRDAVIDGRLVDVKSASSYGFKKFEEHRIPEDDPFGYMDQLNAYHYASKDQGKSEALSGADKTASSASSDQGSGFVKVEDDLISFFVIDKQLGHITLDTYKTNGKDYDSFIQEKKDMVASETPPPRAFSDKPEGQSGNRKLGVECSYCAWKATCWPGLRTFLYSRGPVFLTQVRKEPNVPEASNA